MQKDKYKIIAMLSSIFSILFILITAMGMHQKNVSDIDALKYQSEMNAKKLNTLDRDISKNTTDIENLKLAISTNNNLILINSKRMSELKNNLSDYVLQTQFEHSMSIIHDDHQDTIKSIQDLQQQQMQFQQHVSSEFSNVYKTIVNILK